MGEERKKYIKGLISLIIMLYFVFTIIVLYVRLYKNDCENRYADLIFPLSRLQCKLSTECK